MITVDLSNIWGRLSLPDLLAIEAEVSVAHMTLDSGSGAGSEFLGWMDLPSDGPDRELTRIRMAAGRIRENSDVLVVIGTGCAPTGARGVIELLQGTHRNLGKAKGDPQIFFAGSDLSTRSWNELVKLLEGKDYSLCVVSKSGSSVEPAITFRGLRWMLERKYGSAQARKRIYAVTDPNHGPLRHMAQEEGWEHFAIPENVGSRYSVLTAAGLLPMAAAGIDITELLRGAMDAKRDYDLRSYENPVWLYAATRNLLYRHGRKIELLGSFEPDFRMLGSWWQQLMAGSEGKDGKGIFPATGDLTAGLHTMSQLIAQGERNLFETVVQFDPPERKVSIDSDVKDLDGLNDLAGLTLCHVQRRVSDGAIAAHSDSGVPVVTVDCGGLSSRSVGELMYFFELACGISAYMLGVNPFDQPGVEEFKRSLREHLANGL